MTYPAAPPYAPVPGPPVSDQWPPPPTDPWGPPPPSPGHPGSRRSAPLFVALLVLCGLLGVVIGASWQTQSVRGSSRATPAASLPSPSQALPTPASPSTNGGTSGGLSAGAIAAQVDGAVVDINTTLASGKAAGTGIVLTDSGLVLTNNHVILGATDIQAQIGGVGATYPATVLGYSVPDDVALIQLQGASGLQTAKVADSSTVKLGDRVVALGNALGRSGPPAVSEGSVTALDQQIGVTNDDGTNVTLSGLIEINAGLQPGDSGGPLVNSTGEVIGMNAAATFSQGRTTNDGFAIPINTALDIARQIETGQSTSTVHVGPRALLGIQVQSTLGTTVGSVEPGGPAEAAGVQAGDTIISVDSTTVSSLADLRSALDPHRPGDSVKLGWIDGSGQHHTATVQLIAGPPG
ncbi:MAG: hypothetical protein QOH64_1902 [Acidimicrobiaceae bacterium]